MKKKYSRVKLNLKSVIETLEEFELDPVKELAKLVQSERIDDDLKTRVFLELTNYIHAKKKAIEHSTDPEKPMEHKWTVEFLNAAPDSKSKA